jgi:hypothetical protein
MKTLLLGILVFFALTFSALGATTTSHTVKSGDTLFKIAQAHNLSTAEIYKMNKIEIDAKNVDRGEKKKFWVYPGQEIIVYAQADNQQPPSSTETNTKTITESDEQPVLQTSEGHMFPLTKDDRLVLYCLTTITMCFTILGIGADRNRRSKTTALQIKENLPEIKLTNVPQGYLTSETAWTNHFLICAKSGSNDFYIFGDHEHYSCYGIDWLRQKIYQLKNQKSKQFVFLPPLCANTILSRANLCLQDIRILNNNEIEALR